MNMKTLIAAFPDNITEALEIAGNATIRPLNGSIDNIVICGMGGSGIGGRLVTTWVNDELNVPVYYAGDYDLPAFVSNRSLVIGSSYSGNTEETLSSVRQAAQSGARVIGVTSGGELLKMCRENDFDVITVPGGNPPRAALAYSLVQLLQIFSQLGLISSDRLEELKKGRERIITDADFIQKQATELAKFLYGSVGILYGTTDYEPVLIRARQQFNENSKSLCWHHVIPEMNHNELVGWGGGDDRFAVVFFDTDMHPRNRKRMEIAREVIQKKTTYVTTITAQGDSRIERSIYLIHLVDWASWYLSEHNGADAIEIEVIDYLKGSLAAFEG